MPITENKVKFGLKNVHYATMSVSDTGVVSFGTPVAIPGAVNLSLKANGSPENFYADNGVYYIINNNAGYTGDLEIAGVDKVSHYETLKEYPNGGKDVKEVIDVQPVKAMDAYDEQVQIQKYLLYTADELAAIEVEKNTPSSEQRIKALEDALMAMMGVSTNA